MTRKPESSHIATGGESYYPEMGETHDHTALFVAQYIRNRVYLTWTVERHAEALAAFMAHRIRAQHVDTYEKLSGGRQWSGSVTFAAYMKLQDARLTVTETLLD